MESYADLHCHPHMRSFNHFRGNKIEKRSSDFHPWHIVASRLKPKNKGKRASAYSQSDLIKLTNGGVKLAFVSLYPIEKGWVRGREGLSPRDVVGLIKSRTKSWILKSGVAIKSKELADLLQKVGDDKKDKLSFRDLLQMVFMKIPLKRIEYLQSDDYDYFKELIAEKDFLLSKNSAKTSAKIHFPPVKKVLINKSDFLSKNKEEFQAIGTYEIARGGNDVKRITEEGKIAFVVTIEGSNVLNTNEDITDIEKRIDQIKNWGNTPVFFISFAHHFSNNLCGHAKSIPDLGSLVLDQSEFLNLDFESKGLEIIRYLLSIDNNYNQADNLGRRILIDVKHMSACARLTYYQNIIRPCRINNIHIPIIASHVAYSGIKTLSELISQITQETDRETRSDQKKLYNTWSINLSDEDIIEIFRSKGIIGISFDQRMLAIPRKNKKDNSDIGYFWANFSGMLDVVINYGGDDVPEKQEVVNLFCIGTDFDGYIDPMDRYPTALEFKEFRKDLINKIEEDIRKDNYLFGLSIAEFVDRFCYKNAFNFVTRNFM